MTCDRNEGHCYEGFCRSRTAQCRMLFGPRSRSCDRVLVYDKNVRGGKYGNCGLQRKCQPNQVLCGLIWCEDGDQDLATTWGRHESIVAQNYIHVTGQSRRCIAVNYHPPFTNFSLAFDGTKCDDGRSCSNLNCIDSQTVCAENCNSPQGECREGRCLCRNGFEGKTCTKPCPYDCNNHGICQANGHCICFDGYSPPFCTYPGQILPMTTVEVNDTTPAIDTTSPIDSPSKPPRNVIIIIVALVFISLLIIIVTCFIICIAKRRHSQVSDRRNRGHR